MAATVLTEANDRIGPLGVLNPPDIYIECEAFRGSLALLFACVKDRKIDLLDVPLAPICEAYFRYVIESEETSLDSTAVALTALCYLLERKAWALIPVNEEEEPEGDDILDVLDPYIHNFAPAIEDLMDRRKDRDLLFFRTGEASLPYEVPFDTSDVTPHDLARAFESLLARAKPDTVEPLGQPRRSLTEMMVVVLKALPENFETLDSIVVGEFTRSEVVWWFLALLELIRLGQARVIIHDREVKFARGSSH
ncbi:hypothetical protein QPK87_28340 [Kamptonema cortianum]|nr:hypothetical protein [Geitlerinema splendidum]MDK3160436.1 hypothetical protein [Kamptonema cortianum]